VIRVVFRFIGLHYCLDLAELLKTDRVVPVVVFLRGGCGRTELVLGGEHHSYLNFRYLACALAELPFERYRYSDNIVVRLNLPNMMYRREQRVEVYAHAVRGLTTLEPDPEKQLKYLEFIDIYSGLDDNELTRYQQEYPEEAETMTTFAERFIQQGKQEGRQEGRQEGKQEGRQEGRREGEARILIRLLTRRFGEVPEAVERRIKSADADTLLEWSDRVLTARSLEDVVH